MRHEQVLEVELGRDDRVGRAAAGQASGQGRAAARLRQFERHGIVTRTAYAEIPPRVEYALTPLSEGLRAVLEAMGAWAMAVPDPEPGVTA
ncbi:winged helix-turn-helix transcriptional regulator [Streptomyces sp. SID12501]|uniref:Winged helix-turn-helix transcriptional regulator n=1 Tax=Streptomyces sp. SID12501 TaxID=2706042 RepID=A0A6B3C4L1_9ACTN|nr:winged helix-turn-helix transcriptional regulator [Streptomyces sp. SID12501]